MYNALDAVRTYELWQQEKDLLLETGQLSLFTDTIMAALPTLIHMGQTGIRIDSVRRDAWLAELGESGKRLLADWNERTGGVNPNSTMQLKKLFASLGMTLPYNKDGGESVDQLAMAKLRIDYPEHAPMLDKLQEIRRTFKDMETYALVNVGTDGRVHPSFVPAYKDEDGLGKGLAGTWRITAKDPNLQNQPTRARRMYVPTDGFCYVGADYSQLEARILAAMSGDDVLLADCNGSEGTSIHERNAKRLGVDKVRAKNGFYGWSYLAGAKTLQNTFSARGFRVAMKECEALLEGFDKVYTKAASFRKQVLAEAQARRYVQNPFGLRRYFPHAKWPAPSAMSTHIQSTGAIMMWRILPQLEQVAKNFDGNMLLSVHDDILMEVPIEHANKALASIQQVMEQRFHEVAPDFYCPVQLKDSLADDGTTITSWGELRDVKHSAIL
jgi:DNA polymerase-1